MTNEEIMAVVKPSVCSKLKCPASAKFPVELISVVGDDVRGYEVSGFVDSQNSYGAMLRTKFTASVSVGNGFPIVRNCVVGTPPTKMQKFSDTTNTIGVTVMTIIAAVVGGLSIGLLIYSLF